MNLQKVAAVLDALAEHVDAEESTKVSTARAVRESKVDALANKYAEATGDDLPTDLRKKLAESDEGVVGLLQQVVEKQASKVEALGGPSNRDDEKVLVTTKEAADAAYDRFGNWLVNG